MIVGALALLAPQLLAQPSGAAPATPSRGGADTHPKVSWNAHHGESRPLRDLVSAPTPGGIVWEPGPPPRSAPLTPTRTQALQTTAGTATATTVGTGFSSGPSGTGTYPPDPNIAVGTSQVVQVVNLTIEVWSKAGAVLVAPKNTNSLWSGYTGASPGNACSSHNDGDAVVRYDALADRWLITQFSLPHSATTGGPSFQCVAVSKTGDATGAYWLYDFSYAHSINDYGKLGVWPDGYYVTFNMFDASGSSYSYGGAESCVYEKAAMLLGDAAQQVCFGPDPNAGGLLPSTPPPVGTPDYLVGLDPASNAGLEVRALHVDWTTPASSTLTQSSVAVPSFALSSCAVTGADCVPSPGGNLADLGDRLMFPLSYRYLGGHQSLVVSHTVDVGAGVLEPRWYELRVGTDALLHPFQSGTYAPGDGLHRWMSSAAMDQAGDIALGYSASNATTKPSVRYTARAASDPLGDMTETEGTLIAGGGSQSTGGRWGDYSSMVVDPSDDCTFWYVDEYYATNSLTGWSTRISSLKFNGCGVNDFSLSAPPSAETRNRKASAPITTGVTKGSGEDVALAVYGLPSGATYGFTPATVTSGSGSTLTIDASGLAPGSYPLQIGGASASTQHATAMTLTVTDDYSVGVSPTSATISTPTDFSVATAALGSATPTLGLSVEGLPTGATAAFTPSSVTAGAGSTLRITPGGAAAGTYPLSVVATDSSLSPAETRSTPLSLTITSDFAVSASPTALLTNGSHAATTTVSTTVTAGSPDPVQLVVSGLPSGATAPTVGATTGSPATVTINPGTAASGLYSLTLTATDTTTSVSHSVPLSFRVDRTKPVASVTKPSSLVTVATSATVAWTGSDSGSGIAYYDIRYVRAPYSGGFSAWPTSPPSGYGHLTVTSKTVTGLLRGYTYCYEVRATDKAANVSAWSAMRCTAIPLDDRSLAASTGWTRATGSAYWAGTITRSSTLNKTLTRTGAQLKRVALVFRRCSTCGTVGVYVNGVLVGKVSTSGTAANKVVVALPALSYRTGAVTLKILTSGKPVLVDGLAITRV